MQTWTKQSAAKAEIHSAIELFVRGEVICAHVLASAAAELTRQVVTNSGGVCFREHYLSVVRPEKRREFITAKNKLYNYAKHADQDSFEESSRYNMDQTAFMILEAVVDYGAAFKTFTPAMYVYSAWTAAKYPDIYIRDEVFHGAIQEVFGFIEQLETKDALQRLGTTLNIGTPTWLNDVASAFKNLDAPQIDFGR